MPILTTPAYYIQFDYEDKEFIWGIDQEGNFYTPMVSSMDGWVLTEYDIDDVDYLSKEITIHGTIVEFTILNKDLNKEIESNSLPFASKYKSIIPQVKK